MTNPLTMFTEKKEPGEWSMSRVIAWMAALTCNTAMLLYALKGAEIGWPFAVAYVSSVLAMSVLQLFKNLPSWFAGALGKKLLHSLAERITTSPLGGGAGTKVTTEVETGGEAP